MPRKRGGETGGEGAAGGPLPPQPALSLATDPLLKAAGAPERANPDGSPNIDYFRWTFKQVNDKNLKVALGLEEMPKGYNLAQARELLESEVKNAYRLDPGALADVRSPQEKLADSMRELLAAPESLFEKTDEQIVAIKAEMDKADDFGKELLGGRWSEDGKERAFETSMAGAKKKWSERLSRLLEIRHRAREPFPGGWRGDARCIEAMHTLRFMLYVGRSSIGGDATVFSIGEHHAKMASELWQARNSWMYRPPLEGGNDALPRWHKVASDGVFLVCPPGHGKSNLVCHDLVLQYDYNPRLKGLIGHAQSGEAEKDLAYIGSYFLTSTANGRRNLSLFPKTKLKKLVIDTLDFEDGQSESKRQPSLKAHGITAKVSGADADFIWFDDPCDQEHAEQETTRKRVFDRMNGTWRRRKRGKKTFEITTTTLWHHQDPNCLFLELIKDNKIDFLASVQVCGGPNSSPPFKSLWPEQYPASRLKKIYIEMRNPRLYAAAYEANPQPAGFKKIKRLAFYDPTEESHAEFIASAVMYLSVDPAATNSEKADYASFLYAGLGDVPYRREDGGLDLVRRLRVVDAREFHATQGEAVDEMMRFAEQQRLDYTLWEVRSAFAAGPEMLRREFGLDVIELDPKNKKKGLRLDQAAPLIDDSLRDKGLPAPPVEFPGVRLPDGTVGPDPALGWFYDQILNFGACKGDHSVDALTQLVNEVGRQLGIGEGVITTQVRRLDPTSERVRAWRDRMFKRLRTPGESAAEQDCRWAREALEN